MGRALLCVHAFGRQRGLSRLGCERSGRQWRRGACIRPL